MLTQWCLPSKFLIAVSFCQERPLLSAAQGMSSAIKGRRFPRFR